MPEIALGSVMTDAGTVAAVLGPYVTVALAFVFGPRLLKLGIRLIKGE